MYSPALLNYSLKRISVSPFSGFFRAGRAGVLTSKVRILALQELSFHWVQLASER
jgi:hypothetical protein